MSIRVTVTAGLVLAVIACTARAWLSPHYPSEDAAMLLRYSDNLAHGYGIVWNRGESPVDGATDFLFMVVVGILARLGLGVEVAARLVIALSHLLTVLLVYAAARRLHGAHWLVALLIASYVGIGPGLAYTTTHFGTPVFALMAATTWCLATLLGQGFDSRALSLGFALSALTLGLIRPDGVFLAVFMLLAIVYLRGLAASKTIAGDFIGTFAVLGGAYFLWHVHYFGYLLPNPFYKKGGGHLYPHSLLSGAKNTLLICGPLLLPFVMALRSPGTRRLALFALIPIAGFTVIWILLSDETNYLGRFQYATLPIAAIGCIPLLNEWLRPWATWTPRRSFIYAGALIAGGLLLVRLKIYTEPPAGDGRYDVAMILAPYAGDHHTLVTTEAGLLPFYSRWRAIDAWGLNDQWIAHHGDITEAYLDHQHPDVIMAHAYYAPTAPPPWHGPPPPGTRDRMLYVLKRFADQRGYICAAVFGPTPHETHYYYVRRALPEAAEITRRIRALHYAWWKGGKPCVNWAVPTRPGG